MRLPCAGTRVSRASPWPSSGRCVPAAAFACYDRNQTRGQLMMTLQASTQTEDAVPAELRRTPRSGRSGSTRRPASPTAAPRGQQPAAPRGQQPAALLVAAEPQGLTGMRLHARRRFAQRRVKKTHAATLSAPARSMLANRCNPEPRPRWATCPAARRAAEAFGSRSIARPGAPGGAAGRSG